MAESDRPSSTKERFLRVLEVPIDASAGYKNDVSLLLVLRLSYRCRDQQHWTNRDLIPMPAERRTYAIWSYVIYWCISGMCISAYTTGSTLLSYGLTPQQAIVALVVGALFTGLLSISCGWMGERYDSEVPCCSRKLKRRTKASHWVHGRLSLHLGHEVNEICQTICFRYN